MLSLALWLSAARSLGQHTYDSDAEGDTGGGGSDDATGLAVRDEAGTEGEGSGKAGRGQAALDPETVFMQVRAASQDSLC